MNSASTPLYTIRISCMMSEVPVSQLSSLNIEDYEKYVLDAEFFENGTLQHIKGFNGEKISQLWAKSRSLGKGTFGQVRQEKLEDENGDWQYRAVKICQKGLLEQSRIDFTRELSALAAFSSPKHSAYFVNLMGWWSDSQNLYIAMEYVWRGDLSNYINQPLLETDAKEIITDILNGLYVMHQEGFTHRDIKPQNILVVQKPPESQKWWVKIADFGITKRVIENDKTALHTLVGTRPYCAPEILGHLPQSRDTSVYSNKADMWSLGCVLFNISSRGYTPFSEPELVRYCDGNLPFNPQERRIFLGSHGLSLLQAFLHPNPERRPSAVDALNHGWFKSMVDIPNEDVSTFENSLGRTSNELSHQRQIMQQSYNSFLQPTLPDLMVEHQRHPSEPQSQFENPLVRTSNEPSHQREITQRFYNSFLQPTLPDLTVEHQGHHSEPQPQLSNSPPRNSTDPQLSNQNLQSPSRDSAGSTDINARQGIPRVDDFATREEEGKVDSLNPGKIPLRVGDTLLGKNGLVVRKARCMLQGHTSTVNSVSFSPDGRQLASGSDDMTIKLWDVATGEAHTLKGHTNWVLSVMFSPDGRLLASGCKDGTIKLWDVAKGEIQRTLEGHTDWVSSVAFSPDGQMLVSGFYDGTVMLWDVTTGEAFRTFDGHSNFINPVVVSPDGRLLVSRSDDNTMMLWDVV